MCAITKAVGCNETEGPAERGHDKKRSVIGEQEAGDRGGVIRTAVVKPDEPCVPLRIKTLS